MVENSSLMVELPIPKLSLHNSAAFCFWQKHRGDLPNFLTLYTLASLNYTLSVSEYVTTNVTAKPVTFLRGTNNGCTVGLSCAAVKLQLLQENNLSNSIPQGKISDRSS